MGDQRLVPEVLSSTAQTPTQNNIATGTTYQVTNPQGRAVLYFEKAGAGNATITVTTPMTQDGLAVADLTFTVVASNGREILMLKNKDVYNNADGDVEFTTDEGTGLTCIVVRS